MWGAGSESLLGNQYLKKIMDDASVPSTNRFHYSEFQSCAKKLLEEVDRNGDRIISSNEANSVTIKLVGYSWGATHLAALTQKISRTGWIGLTDLTPKVYYKLQVAIPVDTLATIDPVTILMWGTGVNSNVQKFYNWYQSKRGNGHFRNTTWPHCAAPGQWKSVGTKPSRIFRGVSLSSSAATTVQWDVTSQLHWYYVDRNPNPDVSEPTYRLYGKDVNHDVIPLFVDNCVLHQIQ
jgi:hypothetical protein